MIGINQSIKSLPRRFLVGLRSGYRWGSEKGHALSVVIYYYPLYLQEIREKGIGPPTLYKRCVNVLEVPVI